MTPAEAREHRRRFAFRLALALGQPNPDAMLSGMPDRIFTDWMAYANVEPFGEERADLRAGIVASVVANVMGRKKGQRPYKPSQFMPRFEPKRTKTPDELFNQIKAINWMMGGKFVDKRGLPPLAD